MSRVATARRLTTLAVVALAACHAAAMPRPGTKPGRPPAPDAAAAVASAEDHVDAAAEAAADAGAVLGPLVPLATSLDGVWDFAESCLGVPITYTLTVSGPRAELVTSVPDASRSQSLELRGAPSKYHAEVGAIATVVGKPSEPLFRLVRSDAHVLSRLTFGNDPQDVSRGRSTEGGAFQPRCTTFASFIERSELEKQAWTHATFSGLSVAYPSKVFRLPAHHPKGIDFMAPTVWATSMAGQKQAFAIQLSVTKEDLAPALSQIVSGSADIDDPANPFVAGHRGAEIQMGIEGVGQHNLAVRLKPHATLVVRISWVDGFANEKLTMSSDMQLAIADRMIASIDPLH